MKGAAFLALLVVVGCRFNPQYCEDHPGNNCDLQWDAPVIPPDMNQGGCTNDSTCTAPTAVCELTTHACVQCTAAEPAACTNTTPVCGANDACRGCVAHSECPSNVCLPDGSCGTDSNVAYVDPTGTDNTSCTKVSPCTKVAKALATARPFVKFAGTTDEAVAVNSARNVTFLAAPGAVLTRSTGAGAIITVSDDNTNLQVFDLSIKNAPNNPSGFGLAIPSASGAPSVSLTRVTLSNNPGGGISASGGTLTVTQSKISVNAGGGISILGAQFTITNNFIVGNGSGGSFYGGIQLNNISSAGTHKIDFNTITANTGGNGTYTGISCPSIIGTLTFSNDIIYGNTISGAGAQVGGAGCSCAYSDVGPTSFTGTGNINADPLFVNAAAGDFHITANSPCKDAADPAATLNVDFDGDSRPQGSGRDIGADEYK